MKLSASRGQGNAAVAQLKHYRERRHEIPEYAFEKAGG